MGVIALGLIVAGGIYLSAHLPQHVPLAPAVILLALSAALMGYNLLSLTRVSGFAWRRFFEVARWALLAYCVTAGMIEFVFVRNHVTGAALVVLSPEGTNSNGHHSAAEPPESPGRRTHERV